MPGDRLDPARCGGDLCVQACADDPQVAFHAVRNLARLAAGVAKLRWTQLGFKPAGTGAHPAPRNLFGFKDGINNIQRTDQAALAEHVWAGPPDAPDWMHGGSFLVARRIGMALDVWDNTSLDHQQQAFGRHKLSGAPLGSRDDRQPLDLQARAADGRLQIPENAHARVARGDGSVRILRRGYSFVNGSDPRTGQLDAGLFFICFGRDPGQFVSIQQRLAASDALNAYITHTASAIFACPPGALAGGYLGEGLL